MFIDLFFWFLVSNKNMLMVIKQITKLLLRVKVLLLKRLQIGSMLHACQH